MRLLALNTSLMSIQKLAAFKYSDFSMLAFFTIELIQRRKEFNIFMSSSETKYPFIMNETGDILIASGS